jgi:catechol 2,3-dioxygenase
LSTRLIAQLAHLEVLTPTPDETVHFFRDIMGLEESGRHEDSIFLRGWGEWNYHSLQITEGSEPELGHIAWRAASPEHLDTAVKRLQDANAGVGWIDGSVGHGPAFRYESPGGHLHEIFWEVETYTAPADLASSYPDRPQRYVPRGVAPRQIDHVTVMTGDPLGDAHWYRDVLQSTLTAWSVLDEDQDMAVFAMITNNEKSHDLGLVVDGSGIKNRMHHLSYWVDSREELLRAADIFTNADVKIEFGPGRHGMGEQDYLYVFDPASGLRVEINTGGYRLYAPDWEAKKWTPSQGSASFYRNIPAPDTIMIGYPPSDPAELAGSGLTNPWSSSAAQ